MNLQDWAVFAKQNTPTLLNGMNDLNAIKFKQKIPEFIGDAETGMGIDEWFRIAERVARTAN